MEIKWNKVCADVADPSGIRMYTSPVLPFTKISFVDPNLLAELVYGSYTPDGVKLEYVITPCANFPVSGWQFNGAVYSKDRFIKIDQLNKDQVEGLASKVGIYANSGLNIVTALNSR